MRIKQVIIQITEDVAKDNFNLTITGTTNISRLELLGIISQAHHDLITDRSIKPKSKR